MWTEKQMNQHVFCLLCSLSIYKKDKIPWRSYLASWVKLKPCFERARLSFVGRRVEWCNGIGQMFTAQIVSGVCTRSWQVELLLRLLGDYRLEAPYCASWWIISLFLHNPQLHLFSASLILPCFIVHISMLS